MLESEFFREKVGCVEMASLLLLNEVINIIANGNNVIHKNATIVT